MFSFTSDIIIVSKKFYTFTKKGRIQHDDFKNSLTLNVQCP